MTWTVGNKRWYKDGDPAYAVYVGRPQKGGPPSPLANPFSTEPNPSNTVIVVDDPIAAYRRWLRDELENPAGDAYRELARLALLRDGELLCWCVDRHTPADAIICHAQVIARAIDWFRTQPLHLPCLTLTQPWASLVACGAKRIETRPWRDRWRGLIGIHAGAGLGDISKDEFEDYCEAFAPQLRAAGYSTSASLPRGYLLAIADVSAIEPITPENTPPEPERSYGNYGPGRYAWKLRNVTPLLRPLAARGKQKLWWYTLPAGSWWQQDPIDSWIETGR